MLKILAPRPGWLAAVLCVALPAVSQVVNRASVDAFLAEGELNKAEKALASYLKSADLTYPDSVYILKNLGVIYSSQPKHKDAGDKYFYRLLELDPFASLHDTYASNSILARFRKIRKDYQAQRGGKALVPAVAVFDFQGPDLKAGEGAVMAQQLIAELQRLEIFHTLDRSAVIETMDKMRRKPEKCTDRECRLDIARRLSADKLLAVEVAHVDTLASFTVTYLDAETGQIGTTFRKLYGKSAQKLMAEGFTELATELQDREAAWLNLTVNPANTSLTIDGSPMALISARVPLNPGKHKVCGSSPGYGTVCKEFEVKKNDAVTYSLVLPIKGEPAPEPSARFDEDDEEDPEDPPENEEGSKGFVWWTLGSMAVLAVTLAVLFNTKD